MTENNFLSIGNATTIINTIALMCAGPLFAMLVAHFGSLPINETQLAMIIGFVITTVFAYINAKYHNTFWDKETDEIVIPINVTDATENGINETIEDLVEKYGANSTINVEVVPATSIEEDDVAVDGDGC